MTHASDRALRRWAFAVLAGSVAVAVYVSLVPFSFVRPTTDWVETFRRTLERTMSSRGNFLANVLLFVPIGLAGTALVTGARGPWFVRALAGLVVAALGVALSVGIEMMQVLLPGRTPSLSDITAQTAGTAVGAGVWGVFAVEIGRFVDLWRSRDRYRVAPGLLGTYTAIRVLILLLPLDVTVDLGHLAHKFRDGRILLNPLRSPIFEPAQWSAMMLLFVLSMPVGVFASIVGVRPGRGRTLLTSLALVTGIFALAEAAQVFIMSTRADAGQFLVNAAGGAAGVLLAVRVLWPAERAAAARLTRPAAPVTCAVIATGFYAAYHWSPFDFQTIGHADLHERLARLVRVPFAGYYQNPEFVALAELLIKIAIALPIGLTLRWAIDGVHGYPRLVATALLALVLAFIIAIELGQVFLPARYPDGTDVLLACVGVALGWMLARLVGLTRR